MTGPNQDNLLLRTLPPDAVEWAAVREEHPLKTVLITAMETPAHVFFPHRGAVCSIIRTTASGLMVEAGVVGGEGVFNVHTLLTAPSPTASDAVVQHEGAFTRLEAARLPELLSSYPRFREASLAFASVFLDQVTQNLLCNRLHLIEQRLAKWLLVMRDRVLTDELHLTQEFLSYMLGVHRPGVSIAVSSLETDGLIEHRRNRIAVVDRARLEERSCECYRPLSERLSTFVASVA